MHGQFCNVVNRRVHIVDNACIAEVEDLTHAYKKDMHNKMEHYNTKWKMQNVMYNIMYNEQL